MKNAKKEFYIMMVIYKSTCCLFVGALGKSFSISETTKNGLCSELKVCSWYSLGIDHELMLVLVEGPVCCVGVFLSHCSESFPCDRTSLPVGPPPCEVHPCALPGSGRAGLERRWSQSISGLSTEEIPV